MIEALVVNRLLKWQRWKFKTGVALGYPSSTNFMRLAPSTTSFQDPRLDADCLMTDKAVNLLPEIYKLVIRLEYIDAIPGMEQKARCYGKSIRTYQLDRSAAYLLLGNMIDALVSVRQKEVA